MMADSMTPTQDEPSSAVEARCTTCGDVHPLGDRPMGDITTVCPHCGDTAYSSQCDADPITKSHADRIADAVRDIHGVGDQTRANIVATYGTYYEFEAADARELQDIDGVGKQTARRIVDAR